jgi:two-component system chemotaxis sensor kinase CheA
MEELKMSENFNDSMLNVYLFETSKQLECLEAEILENEKNECYSQNSINEIFRIMHTIKGSSAMMVFNNITTLAHSVENLFYFLRDQKPQKVDYSALSEMVLESVDFIKIEVEKIKNGEKSTEETPELIENIETFLVVLKEDNEVKDNIVLPAPEPDQKYYIPPVPKQTALEINHFQAKICFESDCGMENIRAFGLIHRINEFTDDVHHIPEEILENDASIKTIQENGLIIYLNATKSYKELFELFEQTAFVKNFELHQLDETQDLTDFNNPKKSVEAARVIKLPELSSAANVTHPNNDANTNSNQSLISVGVSKLDKLMDLMGEMVIAEAMVLQNPEILDLQIVSFQKASRQLHKITAEMQDTIMSIRMVSVATVFQKMQRVVRDMNKKLNKSVSLQLIGEDTEVDKNVIEHISDPLMHLVRNSIDHGIEDSEEREAYGKPKSGTVTLEAKNEGSNVLITVSDDGKGFDKEKIIQKAKELNLLTKPEDEMTEKEIFNMIFLPGFSTNDDVTEFSGRGVGMDVVIKNIEMVGGMVYIESVKGKGSTITLKIPLTMAIIDGMNISVGKSRYTIPITSIKESFKPTKKNILTDPSGNEMIMVRDSCYPILRLHKFYGINTEVINFEDGVLIMVEHNEKQLCIFADQVLGQQQVVVKTFPKIILRAKKLRGLSGCTFLGDGSISLILNVDEFSKNEVTA